VAEFLLTEYCSGGITIPQKKQYILKCKIVDQGFSLDFYINCVFDFHIWRFVILFFLNK